MIDLEKLSSRLVITLIATGLILSSLFLGVHEEIMSHPIGLIHDSAGYGHLSTRYFQLTLCWAVCLIGFKLRQKWLSGVVSIGSLLLTFFLYKWIYVQTNVYLDDTDSLTAILRGTLAITWITVALVLLLLGYKSMSLLSYFAKTFSRNDIK